MPTREQFLQFLQQNPLSDGTPIYVDSFQGSETYYSQLNQPNINVTNIPSTSSTPAAAPTPHMTVDDLLGAPGRESLNILDPLRCGRATWFKYDKGKISKAILKMMKSDLPGAYPMYNHLPRDVKGSYLLSLFDELTSVTPNLVCIKHQSLIVGCTNRIRTVCISN
ncbi:unnamed protein product, partial [Brassica oleracea]